MRITIDTNPLVRSIVDDDKRQALIARRTILRATSVAITLPCLCEVVWVLGTVYHFTRSELASIIEQLLEVPNADMDRPAVLSGLAMLQAGSDFADGVIAYEGRRMGGEAFVSFDRKAVNRIRAQGFQAELL